MNFESSQGNSKPNRRDDSFWAALFEHGEANVESAEMNQSPPPTIDDLVDVRTDWLAEKKQETTDPWLLV